MSDLSHEIALSATRRAFLDASVAVLGITVAVVPAFRAEAAWVEIEKFLPSGRSERARRVQTIVKSGAAWKRQLSPDSYEILCQAGTEPAFHNAYWNNHADGLYRCLGCDTALFDSRTKFHSGTGWHSFHRPISRRNVTQLNDMSLGMNRTAVSCVRCDAHLGHVFDDGPKPTGLRYCMNSAALRFVPRGKQEA